MEAHAHHEHADDDGTYLTNSNAAFNPPASPHTGHPPPITVALRRAPLKQVSVRAARCKPMTTAVNVHATAGHRMHEIHLTTYN